MSVYVDNMKAPYRHMVMCHMTADTIEELHGMADRIGIQRKWFQDTRVPHYDICQSKKKLAVYHGAEEVTARQAVQIAKEVKR